MPKRAADFADVSPGSKNPLVRPYLSSVLQGVGDCNHQGTLDRWIAHPVAKFADFETHANFKTALLYAQTEFQGFLLGNCFA